MKILIIQQQMIGDVLTSGILFEALRQKFPKAQLDYLINEHTIAVVENNPNINNFILFTKETKSSKVKLLRLAKSVRNKQYDVVIDVYSKLSSNLISLFSEAKTKISYHKYYTTYIYHHNIKRVKSNDGKTGLAIFNRMQLLAPLGIKTAFIKPKIYVTEKEIADSRLFLENNQIDFNRPLYMVSVLGSGAKKTYPFNYMAKVIETIVEETSGQILFNYIPNQETEARSIFNLCNPETQNNIFFNVFGENLRAFLAVTYHCDALIGNEGGAINMAKALNIKTFAIFSPWIDKATWSLFENDNNVGVHLKDYKPELYTKAEKTLKNKAATLYEMFKPELFTNKLKAFLK
ncbi:glycosyltransferase family 9 protein [Flavivirga aquimarina]|uniref:Glycosyltransferase family 9 protein n=1 Tax=Flavivirga aquimarina TaxID=2027862 RepID=A0ABT8WA34_9FLAO|nr:glycosyltransferase family 9 protein [Flavivirga aquimarina]MDO5969974.1 glycosyltransferase family 9 protein [Flavivirga aquimarina]